MGDRKHKDKEKETAKVKDKDKKEKKHKSKDNKKDTKDKSKNKSSKSIKSSSSSKTKTISTTTKSKTKHRRREYTPPSSDSDSSSSPSSSSDSNSDSESDSNQSVMSSRSEQLAAAFSNIASSHKAQLGMTAVASGLLVGASILGYQSARRKERTQWLKDSIPPPSPGENGETFDLFQWTAHSGSSRKNEKMLGHSPTSSRHVPLTLPQASSSKTISDEESTRLARKAQSLASASKPIPEDLILEQLSRNHHFLGTDGLKEVRKSFVIVVGLGGVGSWATTILVRSGVGKIRLIDFDQVTLSSLNRHAVATLEDVGTPKVFAMKKHLEKVAPWCAIEACVEVWRAQDAESLMEGEPTYVVDAIDNIDTKVDLLAYCHRNNIPVISSMGAGCKSDPTRICVGDISESIEDPLSKATRRKLRAKGVATGVTVVYSTEKPGPGKAQLLPLDEQEFKKGGVEELGVLPDFRVRILPVLGTMPATFGLTAANHILTSIAKYPLTYLPGTCRFRPKMYGEMLAWFVGIEQRIRGNRDGLRAPLSENDIGYLVEEMFNGKSVVSGATNRLRITRWRKPTDKPGVATEDIAVGLGGVIKVKLTELVVMTKEELAKHEEKVLKGNERPEDVWGEEAGKLVERKWEEERQVIGLYR